MTRSLVYHDPRYLYLFIRTLSAPRAPRTRTQLFCPQVFVFEEGGSARQPGSKRTREVGPRHSSCEKRRRLGIAGKLITKRRSISTLSARQSAANTRPSFFARRYLSSKKAEVRVSRSRGEYFGFRPFRLMCDPLTDLRTKIVQNSGNRHRVLITSLWIEWNSINSHASLRFF